MKEVTLKLSNGKEYKANISELPLGVVKNLCKSINLDVIIKDSKSDEDFINKLVFAVIGAYDIFEQYLFTVFKGLTKEELDTYGTASEVGVVLAEILGYTAFKVSGIGAGLKNLIRAETI